MKIRTLLPALMLSFQFLSAQYCGNSGPAICNPANDTITKPGLAPILDSLTPMYLGETVSTTLQFKNYDTTRFGGTLVTIDSLQIDTIGNLPEGLCWSTNKVNNRYANQESGCIVITGTPCAPPGQYQLYFIVEVWAGGLNIPALNASVMGLYYSLRANNPGEATVAVDTPGEASGSIPSFIAYGPAASCQSGPPSVSLGPDQTVCNGSVAILNPLITGGEAPYTYSWQGTGSALSCNNCGNPTVTITQNSTYIVAVTDAANNVVTDTVNYTLSAVNNTLQLSVINTNVSCTNPIDTTTLTIANGIYPFTLNWGDGSTQTDSTSQSPSHIYGAAGVYIVSIGDSQGCASAVFDTVLNNGISITLSQAVQPNCFGTTTGSITIAATGGTLPYTYVWSNSSTTPALTNITAGYYTVTVTDVTSCSSTFSYLLNSISDPWGYYIYMNETGANCNNNGAISTNVYGGLPPFSYMWTNSDTAANISGLATGTYTVTVTDSAGCHATGSGYITSNCAGIINGIAFYDNSGSCTYTAGDTGLSYSYIAAQSSTGDIFYGSTDNNGNYSIAVTDTGTFTLTAFNYFNSACGNLTFCGNPNQTVYLPVLGDTVNNNNIGFANASGFDLGIHPGWTSADPGFTKRYWVFYYNSSYTPYIGPATITFIYDSNLVYQYSDETPQPVNNISTHTLTWIVDSVPNYSYSGWTQLDGYFQVPSTLSLNYLLQSDFTILPVIGDCDTSDNHYHYSEMVTGSHDPNEKNVSPSGAISESDSVLTYTIHFQNTGTDSTHFVVIKDTLSPNLNPATVRNIASSDKYSSFTISGKGILTWTFNPLSIVDSLTNPSASKRFIMFTVKKQSNLPIGTTISNTASVYFDYNTPVVTNTVADTMAVTGIFEITNNSNISVKAFPNPFNDVTNIVVTGLNEKFSFELYDVAGRLEQSIPSVTNNQFQVQRSGLASGIYLYRITVSNKQVAYGKLVVE